ncbi:MAG: hypothetical protein C0594_02250 [Marinilabiliales bacterium]|nr:MAG: hypothetical protein C0594_02250 [Marinilabiliales bacterium]
MRTIALIYFIIAGNVLFSQGLCIHYLANDGFLVSSGMNSIMVDGLFEKIDGNWCDSPDDSLIEQIIGGQSPFDHVSVLAVSHKHIDHFNGKLVTEFMQANPQCKLVCPVQVEDELAIQNGFENIKDRIISITPDFLQDSTIRLNDIPIRIIRLPHSEYMIHDSVNDVLVNKHKDIENLGFVFSMGDSKVFHMGDASPNDSLSFQKYQLNLESIDVAMFDRMFFAGAKQNMNIVNNLVGARYNVIMHINPSNKELFYNYFIEKEQVIVFKDALSKKCID